MSHGERAFGHGVLLGRTLAVCRLIWGISSVSISISSMISIIIIIDEEDIESAFDPGARRQEESPC